MKRLSYLVITAILFHLCGIIAAQENAIRVGSKLFTEQIVLGQIMLIALEDAGFDVADHTALGPTGATRHALLDGEIDIYPEYTGTGLSLHFKDVEWATIPTEASRDAILGYALASSYDAAINDIVWLVPPPANSPYAFATTSSFAEEHGMYTVSDMADYVNAGGYVLLATGDEFAYRPDGVASFEQTYGFDHREDQMMIIPDGTPLETEQALHEGSNNVNFAMAYLTDGILLAFDFVVLEDDLGAQPIYTPTPLVRGEVIRANPEIAGILNPIFAALTTDNLRAMNARVEVDGDSPADAAQKWLSDMGFIRN